MRKGNWDWIKLANKDLLDFERIDMISGNFGEKTNCSKCNEILLLNNNNSWNAYLKKCKFYSDKNGDKYIKTNIEFYCLNCDK